MILSSTIAFIISAIITIVFLILCRNREFDKTGKRKNDWRKLTPELLSSQIEYHNKATYVVFEFYTKTIFAILGGIAFISISKVENLNNVQVLVKSSGYLLYFITFLYSILILIHQKAKIERWSKSFKWFEVFFWNEFYFITFAWTIVTFINNKILQFLF